MPPENVVGEIDLGQKLKVLGLLFLRMIIILSSKKSIYATFMFSDG